MSNATVARMADALPAVGGSFSRSNPYAAESGQGFTSTATFARRNTSNPRYNALLLEAMQLHNRVLSGDRRARIDFSEAMTRSDFPLLFGDILQRQLLGYYTTQPLQWDMTARRGRVPDFRTVKRFTMDGAEGVLDSVAEQGEYPAATLTEGDYEYAVAKRGRRIHLSWETLINDDLDAFSRIPERLALSARRTEEHFATSLYVGAGGPNSTFFSAGNANIVTGNPALNITGLQAGMEQLNNQTDTDGGPIYVEQVVLEVPPSLEVVANNLINAIEIIAANGGGDGTGNDQLRVTNWLAGRMRIMVNPWLRIIDATANDDTTWYLWASPNAGRPAKEVGFLTGHERPELFMKSPNALRIGGGLIDPMDGDFDTDSIEWKIRHVIGGTLMDPKMAVVSNGTGVA